MSRAGTLLLLLLGPMAAAAWQAKAPRYEFPKDSTIPYRLEIRGEKGDQTEVYTGRPEVRVAGPSTLGGTRLVIQSPGLHFRVAPREDSQTLPAISFGGPRPLFPPALAGPFPGFATHELTVDERGRVIREKNPVALPYGLGTFASLLLEPLPEKESASWTRTEKTWLAVGQGSGFMGLRLLEHPLPPFGRDNQDRESLACEETSTFTRGEGGKETASHRREYRLMTLQKVAGEPRYELNLAGTQVADSRTGLPLEISLKGSLVSRRENITARIPFTVFIHRITDAEVARQKEDQAKAAREARARADEEARKRKEPFSKEERAAILGKLASPESRIVREALRELNKREPEKADPAISARLAILLSGSDRFLAMEAARAMEHHGAEAESGALVKAMETTDIFVANACLKALGRLRNKKAAGPVASKLSNLSLRHAAAEALKAMGPMAEEAVAAHLKSDDWNLRMTACEILAVIATEKSSKSLKKLAETDENNLVKMKAREALDALARRK